MTQNESRHRFSSSCGSALRGMVRAVFVFSLLPAGLASAQLTDTTWTSSTNGLWSTAGNWSNTIPDANTERAVISTASGTTVTLNGGYTIGGLQIASGYTLERGATDGTNRTLTIAAATGSNNFFSNAGTISSGGTSGILSLTFNGGGSTFVNAGTLQATAGTTLELKGNNGTVLPTLVNTGGTIQTLGAGTLRFSSFDIGSGQAAGLRAITGGTLLISSGGTMTTDGGPRPFDLTNVAFTNNGTVNWLQAGTVNGSSASTVMTLSGSTALVNSGTVQFTRDGAVNTFATSQVGLTVGASTASLTNSAGASMNFLAKGSVGGQSNLSTPNANFTINNNGTITLESQSTASFSSLSVGATGANATTLSGSGVLVIRVSAGGTASNVGISGGNVTNSVNHTIRGAGVFSNGNSTFTNDGTITADAANPITLSLNWVGNDNSQIGRFTNNGTFQATGAGGIVINTANVTNNGTFTTGATSPLTMNRGFVVTNNAGKTITIGGQWISGSGGGSLISNSGTITYNSVTTSSNQIGQTGSGDFIKSGAGDLTLTGANTTTGATTVNAGTLFVNTGAASVLTVSNVAGPTVTLTSGNTSGLVVGQQVTGGYITGILTGTTFIRSGAATSPGSTSMTAAAYSTLSSGNLTMNGGVLNLGTGSHTVAQVVVAGGTISNGTLTTSTTNYDVRSGVVSAGLAGASKTLTKSTAGTLTLSGSNSYTGATTISAGMLQFGGSNALYGGTTASWTAANIRTGSGATVAFNVGGSGEFTTGNVTTLLTNLAASTSTSNGMNAGSLLGFDTTNATGGTFTIADAIANTTGASGGARGLRKLGTGILVLAGTSTYTGPTIVSQGGLLVNGQLGNTAVTVQSGGLLGGAGVLLGGVIVEAGGTFSPGNSPGLLSTGELVLAGATLMEIDGLSPSRGVNYDAVDVSGQLTYGGSLLIDFGPLVTTAFADNTTFDLFDFTSHTGAFTSITTANDGSWYAGLTFASTGNGDMWKAEKGSQTLEFTYSTGNLVIVPEPGAIALAGIGIAAAGYAVRRRRCREARRVN